jgi:hypothetical protein
LVEIRIDKKKTNFSIGYTNIFFLKKERKSNVIINCSIFRQSDYIQVDLILIGFAGEFGLLGSNW